MGKDLVESFGKCFCCVMMSSLCFGYKMIGRNGFLNFGLGCFKCIHDDLYTIVCNGVYEEVVVGLVTVLSSGDGFFLKSGHGMHGFG